MFRKMLICSLFLTLAACTSSSDAVNALQDAGFTDIQLTGYSWFACSKDDFYHTGFIAKNPQGKTIKGTVCSGFLFKNSTIRFS
jgi:hypothetical protein